jgi:hypothetical protein
MSAISNMAPRRHPGGPEHLALDLVRELQRLDTTLVQRAERGR